MSKEKSISLISGFFLLTGLFLNCVRAQELQVIETNQDDLSNNLEPFATPTAPTGLMIDGIYCGDRICSGAESCSSCAGDCGTCPGDDTQPPTTPADLIANSQSSSAINLSWTASVDNVGVSGYKVYRNGIFLTTSLTTSYLDSGLSPNTQYSYTVSAFDAAQNESEQSDPASDTTVAMDYDDPSKVILVYNDRCATDANANGMKDSYEMALYYQQKRGVPAENLLAVTPSVDFGGCASYYYLVSSYPSFYNEIVVPLQNKISQLGVDNIHYILLEKNVPNTVYVTSTLHTTRSLDNALMTPYDISTDTSYPEYWSTNPYFETSPTKEPDKSHFTHIYKFSGHDMFLVSRIHQFDIIDRALYGEKYIYNDDGYFRGTGYVDTRYGVFTDQYLRDNYSTFGDQSYGGYAWGDRCMAYSKIIFDDLGWEYKWETTEAEIGEAGAQFTDSSSATIAPSALWYGGWYNFGKYPGGFRWQPGAVACDLNSDSGTNFLQQAFTAGLTAGVGVTGEPYLTGHPRPEVFLYYMLSGYNLAESAALSYPVLKWREIAYGDPLYNPMKAKVATVDNQNPVITAVYATTDTSDSSTKAKVAARIDRNGIVPEVAMFKLEYGIDTAYGSTVDYDSRYATETTFSLDSLTSDTTYHYRVSVMDPVGNEVIGSDQIFATTTNSTILPSSLSITASSQVVDAPQEVNFTSTAGATPVSYQWFFDDGTQSTLANPNHTFSLGNYRVVLVAVFSNGTSRSAEKIIFSQ